MRTQLIRSTLAFAVCAVVGLVLAPSVSATSAPSLLKKLTVSAENSRGYDRDKFHIWIDADGNGCDTRQEVLFRQNLRAGKHCGDQKGRWVSAYDGEKFTDESSLDADHVVPLAEAWGSGARSWGAQTREDFANDLWKFSLIAVSASSNRSKGDSDPAEWLPPKKSYDCRYTARYVSVKYRWKLTVDAREKRAIAGIFKDCSSGSLKLPSIKRAAVRPSKPTRPTKPSGDTDPRFDTCTEAEAAGYGPYRRGVDEEYGWYEDRDGDGLVCEG